MSDRDFAIGLTLGLAHAQPELRKRMLAAVLPGDISSDEFRRVLEREVAPAVFNSIRLSILETLPVADDDNFPVIVVEGTTMELDGISVIAKRSMTINSREHYIAMHKLWSGA